MQNMIDGRNRMGALGVHSPMHVNWGKFLPFRTVCHVYQYHDVFSVLNKNAS